MPQTRKCSVELYRDFLIANHNRYSGVELAKTSPVAGMEHDAISRFLAETTFNPKDLWRHVHGMVKREEGYLVVDDTLLDKRYSRKNELARIQYSGNAHGLVNGICIVNLLWSGEESYIPVDYRIYDKTRDGRSKNDHFLDMLMKAKERGLKPAYVLMDSWYGSIDNLKAIRSHGWHFMTSLKHNRQISIERDVFVPVSSLAFADTPVKRVHLKGYGPVLILRILDTDGEATYVATDDLSLEQDPDNLKDHWHHRWSIEEFHRGIKQTTGIAKCYARRAAAQLTHIFAAFLAFVKLERKRRRAHVSWYEQKAAITRWATAAYLRSA